MNFAQLIKGFNSSIDIFVELGMRDALIIGKTGLELNTFEKLKGLSQDAVNVINMFGEKDYLLKLELFLMTRIFGKGPKVFKPTYNQFLMLENMHLNLTFGDFHTPFETTIIEIPEEYVRTKANKTNVTILHCEKKYPFLIHSVMSDEFCLKSWFRPEPEMEIEEWFADDPEPDSRITSEEQAIELRIRRAALNYCLLLDEVGVKIHGPVHPGQYHQLVKWCKKDNKHTAKNKRQLLGQPIRYSLKSNEVELVRYVSDLSHDGNQTGRKMSPHSRRGHYRMQVHGPQNSLRKRIRIPFTIVNKYMLSAPIQQEYKT